MPDISMCNAYFCPSSATCRRHPDSGTKPTPYRQAWMSFRPDKDKGQCESYWLVLAIDEHKEKR